jgi:hypothetical protein
MWSRHNASVDGIRLGIVAFWCRCARSVSVIDKGENAVQDTAGYPPTQPLYHAVDLGGGGSPRALLTRARAPGAHYIDYIDPVGVFAHEQLAADTLRS